MTRPHEETWVYEHDDGIHFVTAGPDQFRGSFDDAEPARLAAQAPAMARLLLEHARVGHEWECPECGADLFPTRHETIHNPPGDVSLDVKKHSPDCALVAVLRAAGVLPDVVQIPNPDAPDETEPMYADDE